MAKSVEVPPDEKARMQADAREKWLWDQAARKRQYLREGHAEGLAEGESNKQIEIAGRLLGMKMPLADIASATGLSETEIERLAMRRNS